MRHFVKIFSDQHESPLRGVGAVEQEINVWLAAHAQRDVTIIRMSPTHLAHGIAVEFEEYTHIYSVLVEYSRPDYPCRRCHVAEAVDPESIPYCVDCDVALDALDRVKKRGQAS